MVKIYTKTGDKGQTSLFGGKRISKADFRVEAYGTVDELNSAMGLVIATISSRKYKVIRIKTALSLIQNDLLDIGSILASSASHKLTANHLEKRVEEFEKAIDVMTAKLPLLTQFILPGGSLIASQLHLARTICRRCERGVVRLNNQESIDNNILIYFNRLSDFLFTLARFVNFEERLKETVWKK